MQSPPNPDMIRPILDRMSEILTPMLTRSVTPIAAITPNGTFQWGTGTFFAVADESFLVTASHVFDTAEQQGVAQNLCFFDLGEVGDERAALRPVPLSGNVHRVKDPPDVAIFQLEPSLAASVTGRHFLRLSEVALRPSADGCFWVFGFPAEMTEHIPDDSSFQYRHFFFRLPLYNRDAAIENLTPGLHFLLDAAHDDLRLNDSTPTRMPDRLGGISGCSIWQTSWPKRNSSGDINARIVGVQTSYYRKPPLIKATNWEAVASVLYQACPDLRRPIEMHFGSA